MDKFDICFSGKVLPDKDATEVKKAIGRFFKVEGKTLDQLFSGKSIKVKKSVDVDTAGKYREAFRKMGALVDINIAKPMEDTAPSEIISKAPNQTSMNATQASLEDCAIEVTPTPIPDLGSYNLNALGSTLDESPEFQALHFDTSKLQVSEANTGSLEDCVVEKETVEIPDISKISLT